MLVFIDQPYSEGPTEKIKGLQRESIFYSPSVLWSVSPILALCPSISCVVQEFYQLLQTSLPLMYAKAIAKLKL